MGRNTFRKGSKVIGSIASYHTDDDPVVRLDELARTLSSVNEVPERIGLFKATEISLLAQSYVLLKKKLKLKAN